MFSVCDFGTTRVAHGKQELGVPVHKPADMQRNLYVQTKEKSELQQQFATVPWRPRKAIFDMGECDTDVEVCKFCTGALCSGGAFR
jgi:hypothetical protein